MKTKTAKVLPISAAMICLAMASQASADIVYVVAEHDTGSNVMTEQTVSGSDVGYCGDGVYGTAYAPCSELYCRFNGSGAYADVVTYENTEHPTGVYFIGYFANSSTDWYLRLY